MRHACGEWIASTRVEKWNDEAVSERCKHRGMSWTETGVLAVATYAETAKNAATFHTISRTLGKFLLQLHQFHSS